MAKPRREWTQVALAFMGDGQKPLSELVDQATGGAASAFVKTRHEGKSKLLAAPHGPAFLEAGYRLERLLVEFCRPFGQLRYVTGMIVDMPLETFRDEITELGAIFDEITDILTEWQGRAVGFLKKNTSLPLSQSWEKPLVELAIRLEEQRKRVKRKLGIDERVFDLFQRWDGYLSKFLSSRDPYWINLRRLALDMKRDGFGDWDNWRSKIQQWRAELKHTKPGGEKKELADAGSVLESYCKVKHLQKVLGLW